MFQANVFVTDNKKDTSLKQNVDFVVNYESVVFYSTGHHKIIKQVCELNKASGAVFTNLHFLRNLQTDPIN